MTGKFISSREVKREQVDWGSLAWFSSPVASAAKNLVVLEVNLRPPGGHDFHKHPDQEEVIYVLEGEIEQWVDREKRILRTGDSRKVKIVQRAETMGNGPTRSERPWEDVTRQFWTV